MIKGLLQGEGGKKLIVLGLSEENVSRVRSGNDVFIDLAKIGLPGFNVLLTIGAVEEDVLLHLRDKYGFAVTTETDVTGPFKPEAEDERSNS